MPRDLATLADILKACRLIVQFKGAIRAEQFYQDLEKQSAIVFVEPHVISEPT